MSKFDKKRSIKYLAKAMVELSLISKDYKAGDVIRVGPHDRAPEGVQLQVGPRGGKFFYYDPNNPNHRAFLGEKQHGWRKRAGLATARPYAVNRPELRQKRDRLEGIRKPALRPRKDKVGIGQEPQIAPRRDPNFENNPIQSEPRDWPNKKEPQSRDSIDRVRDRVKQIQEIDEDPEFNTAKLREEQAKQLAEMRAKRDAKFKALARQAEEEKRQKKEAKPSANDTKKLHDQIRQYREALGDDLSPDRPLVQFVRNAPAKANEIGEGEGVPGDRLNAARFLQWFGAEDNKVGFRGHGTPPEGRVSPEHIVMDNYDRVMGLPKGKGREIWEANGKDINALVAGMADRFGDDEFNNRYKNRRGNNPNVDWDPVKEARRRFKKCENPDFHSHSDYEDGKCHPATQQHRGDAHSEQNIAEKVSPKLNVGSVKEMKSFRQMGLPGGIHGDNTFVGSVTEETFSKRRGLSNTRALIKNTNKGGDGINSYKSEAAAEYASYLVDKSLGWNLVPDVKLIDSHNNIKDGHAMQWVDEGGFGGPAKMAHQFGEGRGGERYKIYNMIGDNIGLQEQYLKMNLLDGLYANPDRHEGNWMVDPSNNSLWLIDNGYAFGTCYGGDSETVNIDWAIERSKKIKDGDQYRALVRKALQDIVDNKDNLLNAEKSFIDVPIKFRNAYKSRVVDIVNKASAELRKY